MTSLEEHRKSIKSFLNDINEKVRAGLLVERQKIIGFAASESSTNMLEYFLHKKELISSGFKVNHKYFASEKRAKRFLDFDFSKKDIIISLMVKQEEFRDILCYGKEKDEKVVVEAISNITKIRELLSEELGEEL